MTIPRIIAAIAVLSMSPRLAARAVPPPDSCALTLAAKSGPDEFRATASGNYYPYGRQPAGVAGAAKSNYDILWAMTYAQGRLWMGDAGNLICLFSAAQPGNPIYQRLDQTSFHRCEGSASPYPGVPRALPDAVRDLVGDWRPPRIWTYLPANGQLINRTPPDARIFSTEGFRAAGSNGRIIFLAGPDLYRKGINLFAFRAADGAFLGSAALPQYNNIRRWLNTPQGLYTAVLNSSPTGARGSVLRWTGTLDRPFKFDVVGLLGEEGAHLCLHEGRLFVTTWPDTRALNAPLRQASQLAGVWMSPLLGRQGLSGTQATQWRKVWDIGQYEPDPVIATTYGGGPIASFEGQLVWATMQPPGQGYQALVDAYGQPPNPSETLAHSLRLTVVFAGRNFGKLRTAPETTLLYGDALVPVYHSSSAWSLQPTRSGTARFGAAGLDNPYNAYVWSMELHQGRLYLGTMDYRNMLEADLMLRGEIPPDGLGADLWRFNTLGQAAELVDADGGGNAFNQGIRTMASTPSGLFMGTACIANETTIPGYTGRAGGWELLRLTCP